LSTELSHFFTAANSTDDMRQFLGAALSYLGAISEGMVEVPGPGPGRDRAVIERGGEDSENRGASIAAGKATTPSILYAPDSPASRRKRIRRSINFRLGVNKKPQPA
jgi:hypothetical protein